MMNAGEDVSPPQIILQREMIETAIPELAKNKKAQGKSAMEEGGSANPIVLEDGGGAPDGGASGDASDFDGDENDVAIEQGAIPCNNALRVIICKSPVAQIITKHGYFRIGLGQAGRVLNAVDLMAEVHDCGVLRVESTPKVGMDTAAKRGERGGPPGREEAKLFMRGSRVEKELSTREGRSFLSGMEIGDARRQERHDKFKRGKRRQSLPSRWEVMV